MPMQIAVGEKFACFAFALCGVDAALPDVVQLAPRVWAATKLGLDVAEHWDRWVGSIKMDVLRDADFAIYTTMPSAMPEVNDHENQDLVRTLDYLWYGILLQGVPQYAQGFSLHGANVGGEIKVKNFADVKRYVSTFDAPEFIPGHAELQRAAALMDRLRTINTGGATSWPRLRRGLKALFIGTRTPETDGDRLHQFVRAIEALVKPDVGRTRTQFVHRISSAFTLADQATRDALFQLFDLRSHVEHMHAVVDALQGNEDARIATANRRTRQIDVLARYSLLRVVESDALFERFRTDDGIDAFWRMTDAERLALWGERLDITKLE